MEFQLNSFKSWKMMLWKCYTQYASKFGKLGSGQGTGKGQFSFQSPQKSDTKECSNYCTIALISHASKAMLKILQARLQQHMNCELPDVQAGFRRGTGTRIKLPTSTGSSKKQESSRKNLLLFSWLCQSPWLCGPQQTLDLRWEYQTTRPASWETCMQVKKQQLELDMKQQTVSK